MAKTHGEGIGPGEALGMVAKNEAKALLEPHTGTVIDEATAKEIQSREGEVRILTVAERAGAQAADRMLTMLYRSGGDLDAATIVALVEAERERSTEEHRAGQLEKKYQNANSVAPGVRAVLTPKGYQTFINGEHEEPDTVEPVGDKGLVAITYNQGAYSTYGGVYIRAHSHIDVDSGRLQWDGYEPDNGLGYPGVVRLEGLTAGELWQNFYWSAEGDLLEDKLPERNREGWLEAYTFEAPES